MISFLILMQANVMLDFSTMDFFAFLISIAFHIEKILCYFFLTNPTINFTAVTSLGTDGQANLFLLVSF